MLWDSDLPIQEYSDTHVYTTIYDQGSFKPVARLAWLRDDIPQPANDEPIFDDSYPQVEVKPKSKIEVYHYHNYQLGTPNELTDDKGEVVWLADYEAWGNTAKVIYSAVKINQIQVNQNELQPLRFQGQYFDTETGLHYNRFRYYDPDMGMFTTRDPIGLRGGDNVFQYAPNPIGWIDPFGLSNWGAFGDSFGGSYTNPPKEQIQPQTVSTSKGFKIPLPKSAIREFCKNGIVAVNFNAGAGAGISGRVILTAQGVSGYVGGGVGVGFGASAVIGGKKSNIEGSGVVTSVTANGGAGLGASANLTSGTPGASGSAGVGAGIGLGMTSTIGYLGKILDFNIRWCSKKYAGDRSQ